MTHVQILFLHKTTRIVSTAHDAEELRYVAHQGPNKKGLEKRNKLWATSNGPGMGYYNRKKSILGLAVNRKILCRASLPVTTPTQLLKRREFIPQFPIPSHPNSHVSQPNKTINNLIPLNFQSLLKTPSNRTGREGFDLSDGACMSLAHDAARQQGGRQPAACTHEACSALA